MMNIAKLKRFIIGKLDKELPEKLVYHGLHHTLSVLNVCEQYIKRMHIPPYDAYLLRTSALMHDTGYMSGYVDHEEKSVKYVNEILPSWNYSAEEIEIINSIIRATKIPQMPTTLLEQILGDADLDYLGTDSFYTIGNQLFVELKNYGILAGEEEWDKLQLKFLQNHTYHTPFAKKYREPLKQKHLKEILEKRRR